METPVFVSHSHKDQAAYQLLCLALDQSRIGRWDVEQLAVGNPLAEGLRVAIERCGVCVFLATSRSLESRWCLAELGAFWGAGKRVVIFLADPVVQEDAIPPQFKGNLYTADPVRLIDAIRETMAERARQDSDALAVKLGRTTISVSLGRIEDVTCADGHLIALPANEYFDDECIHDSRSALGAYVQRHFAGKVSEVQQLVRQQLQNAPSERVQKTPGSFAASYGIGQCVFLDRPLECESRLALVAVTTQRADDGLCATIRCVLDAVSSLHRIMANNRLTSLSVPVFGSGHGGLDGEVALTCMLIAFSEHAKKRSGFTLRNVDIVVFRHDSESAPAISPAGIRRALAIVGSTSERA